MTIANHAQFNKKRLPTGATNRHEFLLVPLNQRATVLQRLLKVLEVIHVTRELGSKKYSKFRVSTEG